jgi:hypothetical protein
MILLNQMKSCLETELDTFFQTIHDADLPRRDVTKGAFSQARIKLNHQAFIELNDHMIDCYNREFSRTPFLEYRKLAIDGSTLKLHNNEEISKHFSGMSFPSGVDRPMARVSQLYDLGNKLTLDARIAPYSNGERELALEHMHHLTEKDLVILDRGYPAFWFFAAIRSKGAHFCVRMSLDHWQFVRQFYYSGQRESWVTISPPHQSKAKCHELGLSTTPMTLRLIRVNLENGETEILITSLVDAQQFPHTVFADLYHERWGVEENYKVIKCRLQMENFSGETVASIYQDFHARIFTLNFSAIFAHMAQEEVNRHKTDTKHPQQINFTYVLSTLKDRILILFHRHKPYDFIRQLLTLFYRTTESKRANRKFPRNKPVRNHPTFFRAYKQGR